MHCITYGSKIRVAVRHPSPSLGLITNYEKQLSSIVQVDFLRCPIQDFINKEFFLVALQKFRIMAFFVGLRDDVDHSRCYAWFGAVMVDFNSDLLC